ncbi:phospholipase A2 AP-PLA2-I-like [Patiria miniata]|nr:phospholipase A2 AP-PLA2-I-like [Patiria miniata]XP_038049119.1 phospholipase A2 AP-PLA2-I-like [Patiria miniata]XP_038049122.1 phospholipase A2 AP-PLA2-I-like [Patiria miniata]
MKAFSFTRIVLMVCVGCVFPVEAVPIGPESVVGFGEIVMCLGDLGFSEGLAYDGYGCYCGIGGQGTPVDETDSCCQEHDDCYGRAVTAEGNCNTLETYAIPYSYTKYTDESGKCAIKCKAEADYPWYSINPKCEAFMCECDRMGAQCFADKRSSYNHDFVDYDKNSC